MKLRQAAALVLVGWYLMVPPDSRQGTRLIFRRNAPLTQWYKERDFESEAACKAALASFSKTIKAKLRSDTIIFTKRWKLNDCCMASASPATIRA